MFKKILIPIDGSDLSTESAAAGIGFAKQIGADVCIINVTQPFSTLIGFDGMAASYAISDEDYETSAKHEAESYLQPVMDIAAAQQVKAISLVVSNYSVADAIVEVANGSDCDLIYIASHGRTGLSRLLLGSVTSKVMSLTKTSVLVHRTCGQEPAAE